jgi:indolepyruvate ferredoxin oxidoreductase
VTDDLSKYDDAPSRLKKVLQHRSQMDDIQKRLRNTQGVTVIIYEQTCAAEKRRRRKRGLMPDPEKRTFIFDPVCEGCGDCSVQSTCVSVQPKPTELGLKRQIDQDSCNKDFSCQTGFCPSFVTVHTQKVAGRQSRFNEFEALLSKLPEPKFEADLRQPYSVLVAGIGGTGVVTVSAILGMAAHIDQKAVSIFDMTGLAQKNGTVFSHLRLGEKGAGPRAARIGEGQSDVILAFDMLSVMSEDARITIDKQRTRLVDNTDVQTTAYFQLNPKVEALPDDAVLTQFTRQRFDENNIFRVNANDVATKLLGNALGSNMFMVGFSYQQGLLPISKQAIEQAIRLNGTAIDMNLAAFELGRLYAHQPDKVLEKMQAPAVQEQTHEDRLAFLTDYQNAKWADTFKQSVQRFTQSLNVSGTLSSEDRAHLVNNYERQLFRLMSYKDEYEIARLYSSAEFKAQLTSQFGESARYSFNLAPPMLKPFIGARKIEVGAWLLPVFNCLKHGKVLRGSVLDVFGYTHERRAERQWIKQYQQAAEQAARKITPENHQQVVELIALPGDIKGFGHVKEKNQASVNIRWNELKGLLAL